MNYVVILKAGFDLDSTALGHVLEAGRTRTWFKRLQPQFQVNFWVESRLKNHLDNVCMRQWKSNTQKTHCKEIYLQTFKSSKQSQMPVLHWLDWTAITVGGWGWLLLMIMFVAMVVTQIRKAWTPKHLLQFFFPVGVFVHSLHLFSKLNPSPNI